MINLIIKLKLQHLHPQASSRLRNMKMIDWNQTNNGLKFIKYNLLLDITIKTAVYISWHF